MDWPKGNLHLESLLNLLFIAYISFSSIGWLFLRTYFIHLYKCQSRAVLCITGDLTPEDRCSQASMSAALHVMGGTDGKDGREREARVFLSLSAWGGAGRGCLLSVVPAPTGLARPPVRGGVGFLLE